MLPGQASLRYLKLEAKRRLAAGEFGALHQAQLAIAREHGQPNWAALKDAVTERASAEGRDGHALAQLRWIKARFSGMDEPGWLTPGMEELRAHFTDEFLASVTPERLVTRISELAPELRAELTVISDTPFTAQGLLAGHWIAAATEPRPPHRLTGVQARPLGERISDPRTASPGTVSSGPVPDAVPPLIDAAMTRYGLIGLACAGAVAAGPIWTTATGQANLEHGEALRADHAFPVRQITMAVTAVAVLRLVADGRLRLDDAANRYLATCRLADDAVTIRDLLAHTGGVIDPVTPDAPVGSSLAAVAGPVLACSGKRGTFRHSYAGYAVLGDMIAGLTGLTFQEAASRLVLEPLGMNRSRFLAGQQASHGPAEQAGPGYPTATCYDVTADGTFTQLPWQAGLSPAIAGVLPAADGLWATASDIVRLGLGWSSLLSRSLAAQALRPHVVLPNGAHSGLGWAVYKAIGLAGHVGDGPGTAASLLVSLDGKRASAALANRQFPLEPVNAAVLQTLPV